MSFTTLPLYQVVEIDQRLSYGAPLLRLHAYIVGFQVLSCSSYEIIIDFLTKLIKK